MIKNVEIADYRNPNTVYILPYRERRDCFEQIVGYLKSDYQRRICAIYGLRRTGKTVLMQQCIENMSEDDRKNTILLTCRRGSDLYDILIFIENKISEGYRNFFIDEITNADNFQEVGEALANHYVVYNNARIVVTGTDSLGLSLPTHDLQYDRTLFVNTTYISFGEYFRILGETSLDEYIQLGGILKVDTYSDYWSTHDYIDLSIARNLINSIEKSG